MRRFLFLTVLAACLTTAGCAPRTYINQSFLSSEDLKIGQTGLVSLKSTGETIDVSGIKAIEPDAKGVVIIKVHGSYIITGDGFQKVWRLWPLGAKDKAAYEPVKIDPPPGQLKTPTLEKSGSCALLKWIATEGEKQLYITGCGKVSDEKACNKDK
jgi:hypothetical protein